jgi:hypothetical protein
MKKTRTEDEKCQAKTMMSIKTDGAKDIQHVHKEDLLSSCLLLIDKTRPEQKTYV